MSEPHYHTCKHCKLAFSCRDYDCLNFDKSECKDCLIKAPLEAEIKRLRDGIQRFMDDDMLGMRYLESLLTEPKEKRL